MPEQNKQKKVHYIHRISFAVQQRIAGVFVLIALFVIAGLIVLQIQSSHLLDDRIFYNAYLSNAQGVSTETLINISGIEVGRVSSIDITEDNRIHVKFFVYDSFQRLLRSDSTGELNKLSVIGNTSIIIKAGSHELPILAADSIIPVQEPTTIEDLMAELAPTVTRLNQIIEDVSTVVAAIEPAKLQTITQDLALLMNNLQQISTQVAEGRGLVGRILFDQQLEQQLTRPAKDIGPIISDTTHIVKQVKQDMQLVKNILRETDLRMREISEIIKPAIEVANKSNAIASDVKLTTEHINQDIQHLPEMINKMRTLLDSANRTINAVQDIWPISKAIAPDSQDVLIKEQPLDD